MLNKLSIGFRKTIFEDFDIFPNRNFLFLDDEIPKLHDRHRPQIFDPTQDYFNPLLNIDYKRARELAVVLYTLYPQGENTLTVRNGQRLLLKALLKAERFDQLEGDEEVIAIRDDILASPILRRVLCGKKPMTFNSHSVVLARINRAELGDFDALALGLMLMNAFKGQIIVPDFGFYGRDVHLSLIRQERLIAGVNFLDELPTKLRQGVLLIKDKVPATTTFDDAETLARYAGLIPGTNGYNDFVNDAIGLSFRQE